MRKYLLLQSICGFKFLILKGDDHILTILNKAIPKLHILSRLYSGCEIGIQYKHLQFTKLYSLQSGTDYDGV